MSAPRTVTWLPELHMDIELRFTTLSAIMSVLILGIGALVLCYCAEYFDHMRRRIAGFGGELVAFATAMFRAGHPPTTCWWLSPSGKPPPCSPSCSSASTRFRATSRRAATQALLVTTAGGLAMLVGLILLGERCGSYRFSDVLADPPHGTAITVGRGADSDRRAEQVGDRADALLATGRDGGPRRRSAPICTPPRW
jgi:multicomponent Na+:H+ antiporter subunit A